MLSLHLGLSTLLRVFSQTSLSKFKPIHLTFLHRPLLGIVFLTCLLICPTLRCKFHQDRYFIVPFLEPIKCLGQKGSPWMFFD
jgi:hypothetical protein